MAKYMLKRPACTADISTVNYQINTLNAYILEKSIEVYSLHFGFKKLAGYRHLHNMQQVRNELIIQQNRLKVTV